MHIQFFWWKKPDLNPDTERDLSLFVRGVGKDYFVSRIRTKDNTMVDPVSLITQEGLQYFGLRLREPAFFESLVSNIRRSSLDTWALFLSLLLVSGGTIYVGDLDFLLYVGSAVGIGLLIYFGSLFWAMRRYWKWLNYLEQLTEQEPVTFSMCQKIVVQWSLIRSLRN